MEENMILYSIEQILDQGNAQRNKSLRLKRELQWIKTLGTQFLHGMNQKILSKHDVVITFPFRSNAVKAFEITKNICTKLQAMYPNIYKGELVCSFKCNKTTYENLNLIALKNSTMQKYAEYSIMFLKSELCSFLLCSCFFNSSRNHGNQALYLSKHHYWQMITYNIVSLLWKKDKQFEHLLSYSDQLYLHKMFLYHGFAMREVSVNSTSLYETN